MLLCRYASADMYGAQQSRGVYGDGVNGKQQSPRYSSTGASGDGESYYNGLSSRQPGG